MKNSKKFIKSDLIPELLSTGFQFPVRIRILFSFLILLDLSLYAQLARNYHAASTASVSKVNIPKIQILKEDGSTNGWPGNNLFSSTDKGQSWKDLSPQLPKSIKASSMFANENGLFMGTENGKLYRYNGNSNWINEDARGSLPQKNIFGIFASSQAMFVNVDEKGFYKRSTGSKQWKHVSTIPPGEVPFTLYEFKKGILFLTTSRGILKSTDNGNTWKSVYAEKWVNNISGNGPILIGSSAHGLIRSLDEGQTWSYTHLDEEAVYETAFMDGQFTALRTFAPTANTCDQNPWIPLKEPVRLRLSDDGIHWRVSYLGLPGLKTVYDIKSAGGNWYVSHDQGISRSADQGKTWKLISSFSKTEFPVRLQMAVVGREIFLLTKWGGC